MPIRKVTISMAEYAARIPGLSIRAATFSSSCSSRTRRESRTSKRSPARSRGSASSSHRRSISRCLMAPSPTRQGSGSWTLQYRRLSMSAVRRASPAERWRTRRTWQSSSGKDTGSSSCRRSGSSRPFASDAARRVEPREARRSEFRLYECGERRGRARLLLNGCNVADCSATSARLSYDAWPGSVAAHRPRSPNRWMRRSNLVHVNEGMLLGAPFDLDRWEV